MNEPHIESTMTAKEFISSIKAIHVRFAGNDITGAQFHELKLTIIQDLSRHRIPESPEKFLGTIDPLIEKKILTVDETHRIKTILFRNRA